MSALDTNALAVIFPGQGSQEPNMGRDLAESSPEAMELWKKAERISGVSLREIYWDGDATAMAETRYLQPALTVVNVSFWAHLASKLSPLGVAGHSLGEFSALAASQVLPVDDILELVCLRGRLMSEADPEGRGKMAAVLKLTQEQSEDVVARVREQSGKELLIANYNSPAQFVLSGDAQAVDAAGPAVKELGGRLIPLPVSGAFHSPLMAEAASELAGVMKKLSWNKAKYPVFLNVTGRPESDADVLRDTLCRQMTSSVQWIETIRSQWAAGARNWIEVGPKTVLAKLLSFILKDQEEGWTGTSIGSLEGAGKL